MFTPENDLERSLVNASGDPAARPQFYRDLLAADIFAITADAPPGDRNYIARPGETMKLITWSKEGQPWLPVFTSLARLQSALRAPAGYVRLNARDFFEMTRGAHVILNPNLPYGKEFLPDEITAMLDGSIFQATQGYTIEQPTRVLLGQPQAYPDQLVAALGRLFSRHPGVRAAWLALMQNPASQTPPHLVIGIQCEGDWERLVGEAGMVAAGIPDLAGPVDFFQMGQISDSGLERYLREETKPFYPK